MEQRVNDIAKAQTDSDPEEDDPEEQFYDFEDHDGTGESTPKISAGGVLPRDKQRQTASYGYAFDKYLSHADAKLFYQRYQLEQQTLSEAQSPLTSVRLAPSVTERDRLNLSTDSGRDVVSIKNRPDTFDRSPKDHKKEPASPRKQSDHQRRAVWPENEMYVRADEPASGHVASVETAQDAKTLFPVGDNIHITSELSAIYTNIEKILDMRHKFIRLSLQEPGDNPKDDPSWTIYPAPPEPVWDEENNRPIVSQARSENLNAGRAPWTSIDTYTRQKDFGDGPMVEAPYLAPASPSRKPRKPGQNIGEDFDMSDVLPMPEESEMTFKLDSKGVFQVYETMESAELEAPILSIPTIRDFYMDLDTILQISSDGPTKSFAFRRLQFLEGKFNLYFLLNEYQETADSKRVPHRDFYNVRKVDTHVHHSACMNQKHLLRFIKSKMKKSPDEVVMYRDGKHLTLREVFESINLTAYDLSIDTLDMHAHTDSFHRFDKFNLKYNPVGESRLRTIFLKTDNLIQGRYLAELTKEVISDLESSKYQMVEWRISIYGRNLDEWDKLAAWVVDNKLFSHNVRWLIQIPRLFDVYKSSALMETFEQVIINVFQPLFEVTKNPSSHPKLFIFLQRVIGFDSVDDESKPERRLFRKFPLPKVWDTKQNPPYSYWIYYLFANMASLNAWRKQRGFNTFLLRPHCGEAGETDHVAAAVLCCHSISHGILLRKVPLLQYIFYLEQIGIAMSPLSNNALFLSYERNPFLQYFRRGLNVSLSTDDPLQIAFTKEPLIEEYSVAAQIYKLNAVDMCELAKHSVLQSGFEHTMKQRWLGVDYHLSGVAGNNVAKSNVPNIREAFRQETLVQELSMIDRYTAGSDSAQPVSSATLPPPLQQHLGSQGLPSPSTSMQTNHSLAKLHTNDEYSSQGQHVASTTSQNSPLVLAQATRLPLSSSSKDIRNFEVRARSGGNLQLRNSTSTGFLSTQPKDSWADGMGEPRIFPGVVHERTQRGSLRQGSLRQGSSSEKDADGFKGPPVGMTAKTGDARHDANAINHTNRI